MDLRAMELFGAAAALRAAGDVSLLSALVTSPGSAAEIAARLALDPRATERVLEVLVSFDLALRADGIYRAGSGLEFMARELGIDALTTFWAHTTDFLRTGRTLAIMDGDTSARASAYTDGTPILGRMFESAARRLASSRSRAFDRILDIGCGSGVWSLALLERSPAATAIGLDLPEVLPAFRSRAETLGLSARTQEIAGDMHAIDIEAHRSDLVLIANVLHLESSEQARSLVRRAAKAVRAGGELLIVDSVVGGRFERARSRSVYALHLALRTVGGTVWRLEEIDAWLEGTGATRVEEIDLGVEAGPLTALSYGFSG